jgi:hypothetical protein
MVDALEPRYQILINKIVDNEEMDIYYYNDITDLFFGLMRPCNGTVEASHVSEVMNAML